MKIRAKFTKEGHVKFVGHLDTVRLFQRAIKVAGIPMAYSQGFNPHPLVYFAMPLSVGVSSRGEYIDIVTSVDKTPEEVITSLNAVLPRGIELLEAFVVEERTPTLMSLVHEADYNITLKKSDVSAEQMEAMREKLNAKELITLKKGKKKTAEVDIKPMIREVEISEESDTYKFFVKLAAGSAENLSPDLLLKALSEGEYENWDYQIERKELYTLVDEQMISIASYGRVDG